MSSLLLLAAGFTALTAAAKPIRLRNATLAPPAPGPAIAAQAANAPNAVAPVEPPATGLFLIQFSAAPSPAEREQLRAAGVELLQYVPHDAFIARFTAASPGAIRQLGFVTWLGEYRPEYKVDRALLRNSGSDTNRPVTVLLSARATAADVLGARRLLQAPTQSRPQSFGLILRGQLKSAQLAALARSDAVLWIEPAPRMKLYDEVASKIVAGDGGANTLYTQALGYDGGGVKVAVADTGLDTGEAATMHPDLAGRTPSFFYYGSLTDAADEHSHGTHCAGIIAGNGATGGMDENGALWGLGVAPGAQIITQRIFDGVGNFEAPPGFEQLTRDAKNAGADIGSNSWGEDTQGRYDTSAMIFDGLVRDANALAAGDQPYILEFSAGNAGPGAQTIGSPAVGKNVIATGASENDRLDLFIYDNGPDTIADFSSRGSCEDGRIKPDLVAPGTWIASAKSSLAPDDNSWAPIDAYYLYVGGTSQAGPHVAGAAAVFVQYFRETHTNATPSPALVKAALINSATDLDDGAGTGPAPNMEEGWGRADLTELIGSSRGYEFLDQSVLLANNQSYTQTVLVASSLEPLKITLAYTDVPGFAGAIPALVNDLDLEVTGPDGSVYHGNQFADGESVPDAPGSDAINNVEAVHLFAPVPGEYIVRVQARNVVQDARQDSIGVIDQDFGLVVSGDLPAAGTGLILLDRGHYRAPDQMRLKVIDRDLAGSPTVNVLVRSTTEPGGENRVLSALGTGGTFTNTIATGTGTNVADGTLQIANGDLIEVRYFDASAGINRTAAAFADFVPPLLTGVAALNQFGQTTVTWNSDEPATSIVRYGTNATLNLSATNSELTTDHSVVLDGLIANRTNYFAVISTDEAGNSSTNNNGGFFFAVVPQPAAAVLLVDEYDDPFFGTPGLTNYTIALDQLGISNEVWNVTALGSPTLANLSPFRALIWRVPELLGTWSAAEQTAISNYVHGGGGLFVASMEVLTRLDEVNASAFWRNLLHVQSYVTDTGVLEITGTPGAPVGNGIDTALDYAVYEDVWHDWIETGLFPGADFSDTITPATNAVAALTDSGAVVGLRWPKTGVDGPGRVVFLSFPFDAVPTDSTSTNARARLLLNVIQFLAPGVNGLGNVALDSPAYSLPGLITVEVGDSDLAGSSSTTATFSSDTDTNGVAVTLNPTLDPGVFRGTLMLVAATNPAAPGTLRANGGDTVRARYFDASANGQVQATAVVDTNPPAITNVAATPDYVEATVSWDTSEDADSLVQFGESTFLSRTAYNPTPGTSHEMVLPNLLPNQTYYYQVVSRDAAGNQAVDDRNGQFYTFQTLTPLEPPLMDPFDGSGTNWSVQTAEGSQSEWTLGVPDNGMETNAHSPLLAWGSNLHGGSEDYAETFLISPAIDLTGGNQATLKFWHSYDFTLLDLDIINGGELLIITNSTVDPVSLGVYTDWVSDNWEQEEIDLSPFTGRVVYLVWFYQLFSFETAPRPAWLVDDVSLTLSTTSPGTIQITNNLWQARFVLTGPVNLNGKGVSAIITNAPPGQYAISYGNVPFYQTPSPQSLTLAAGSNVVFNGNYSFTDTNANGIADAWEATYLGGTTNSGPSADPDHDGLSNYAEFIAGTDPNNPPVPFSLTAKRLSNGNIRLDWPAAPGHSYRVLASTNFTAWTPFSGWILAGGTATNYTFTPAANQSVANLLRVEATVGSQPGTLSVRAQRLTNNLVRLEWDSAPDRGYRVHGSVNASTWTPVSAWIQATVSATTYTLPPYTNGAPYLFRVEVKP